MDFGVREGVAGFLLFIHFCIAFMLTIELNNILIFQSLRNSCGICLSG